MFGTKTSLPNNKYIGKGIRGKEGDEGEGRQGGGGGGGDEGEGEGKGTGSTCDVVYQA